MFVADLPLNEGVVEAEMLEKVGHVGPAQGMDVQAWWIAELVDVVAEAAVQVGLGNRQSIGRGEDLRYGRGEPGQTNTDPGVQDLGGPVKDRQDGASLGRGTTLRLAVPDLQDTELTELRRPAPGGSGRSPPSAGA